MTADERKAWLAERRTGIGSSDAAAVLGLSPWKTPLHVYLSKVDPAPEDDPQDGPLYYGTALEPFIAEEYTRRTGRALLTAPLCRHPSRPWMLASPDRVTEDGDRLVELKLVTSHADARDWGPAGTDLVPRQYLVQAQHQAAVRGVGLVDVAAFFFGTELRVYPVPRSDGLIGVMAHQLAAFWTLVEAGTPPAPDWSHPDTPALVERLHRPLAGREVELGPMALTLAADYEALGQAERKVAGERAKVKAEVAALMGDAESARLPDGTRLIRKLVRRRGYAVGESEYVSFHVRRPKEIL